MGLKITSVLKINVLVNTRQVNVIFKDKCISTKDFPLLHLAFATLPKQAAISKKYTSTTLEQRVDAL